MVVLRQQELVAEVTHASIHIENVKAGIEGAPRRQSLPVQYLVYVGAGHLFGTQLSHKAHVGGCPGNARGRERRQARGSVHNRRAPVPQLNGGEAPVAVYCLGG